MRHSGCKRTGSGMGIFRRSSAVPAPAPDPAAALADCLRAIAAREAPEDALQPALQAILEATGAQAGAICLFDVRYGLLRLAAEVGISDEGCRALRSIRQDDARGWEMPLQCLRDRRTYLIDAASGGRQVPPLVEAGAAMRSVACLPLCAGETPLGSLVLVALAPRALSEHDLQQLAGPLDEVVRMIEPARLESARRATDRVELLAAAEAEVESARTALADAQARSVALEAEGRRARAEIERLELAERDGRAERERMEKELAETRARFDELAARGNAVEGEIGVLRGTV